MFSDGLPQDGELLRAENRDWSKIALLAEVLDFNVCLHLTSCLERVKADHDRYSTALTTR